VEARNRNYDNVTFPRANTHQTLAFLIRLQKDLGSSHLLRALVVSIKVDRRVGSNSRRDGNRAFVKARKERHGEIMQ
jgi:hypothetical protein